MIFLYELIDLLKRMYNLGARKFVLTGVGLLGCIPSILAQSANSRCSEQVNQLVLPFNRNMRAMVNSLNSHLPLTKFIFVDTYKMFQDILYRPRSYGARND